MVWNYSITFESDTQPPKTYRGAVSGSVGAAARRAIVDAYDQAGQRMYYQSVVVLLEKAQEQLPSGKDSDSEDFDGD